MTTKPTGQMQFGIFSVGDVTTDPTTGMTPTDASRLQDVLMIAMGRAPQSAEKPAVS